jgi:hypothetical protein
MHAQQSAASSAHLEFNNPSAAGEHTDSFVEHISHTEPQSLEGVLTAKPFMHTVTHQPLLLQARMRIPVKLRVASAHAARQLLYSRWEPFSACRSLHIDIDDLMGLNLAEEMLVRFGDSWSKVEEVEMVVLQKDPLEPVPKESREILR